MVTFLLGPNQHIMVFGCLHTNRTQMCSEAILLGGLAMKRNWQNRRKKEGKPTDKPNIVMGSEIHVRRAVALLATLKIVYCCPCCCESCQCHRFAQLMPRLPQVCWEKLTNYFEIEARYVNITEDCYVAKVMLQASLACMHKDIREHPDQHLLLQADLRCSSCLVCHSCETLCWGSKIA